MDLQKIYTDSDFENAAVPAGQILLFNGLENGKPVTRYKDSSGNFGTLSGGGGGGGADVTLGQIDADGNFQPLTFNGTEASNDGSPETVENYYGWNGTLPSPSGGIRVIQGGDAVYYKCASVDTANKTWTGYLAVLGDDGIYSFESIATTGLNYGNGLIPVVGSIYDSRAMVSVSRLHDGTLRPPVAGWIWGYALGTLLPDNVITASNYGVVDAVDGAFTLGNEKYFEFDEQVLIGSSPRTFIFHANLTEGSNAQFVDGGTADSAQVFSVNWGYQTNKLAHHFWSFDNASFAELSSGEHIIALVYGGDLFIAYADGTEIGRVSGYLDTGTSSRYRIGYYCVDDWYLEGEWQSKYCAVYDKALNSSEIRAVTSYISSITIAQ